jgi:hypothetical protein
VVERGGKVFVKPLDGASPSFSSPAASPAAPVASPVSVPPSPPMSWQPPATSPNWAQVSPLQSPAAALPWLNSPDQALNGFDLLFPIGADLAEPSTSAASRGHHEVALAAKADDPDYIFADFGDLIPPPNWELFGDIDNDIFASTFEL